MCTKQLQSLARNIKQSNSNALYTGSAKKILTYLRKKLRTDNYVLKAKLNR